MIRYTEALELILRSARLAAVETRVPAAAAGCTTGEAVSSVLDVPAFANAALDGYALSSADTAAGATRRFVVNGSVAAGSAAPADTPAGTAWEIMTGAPLPGGCDAVVPIEKSQVDADRRQVAVAGLVSSGANRREAGEDFRRGEPIVPAGRQLDATALMAIAASGVTTVAVRRTPRVAVIVTGDEVSGAGGASSIRDTNGPYLEAAIHAAGLQLTRSTRVGDDAAQLADSLRAAAADSDLVITTGGVSAGARDFLPAALAAAGADILFHKVAIRPGKPLAFATLPQGTAVFALPGNPVAVAVGWRFFVVPWLRAVLGQPPEQWPRARLDTAVRCRAGIRFFAKAQLRWDSDAVLRVSVLPGQESFKLRPLVAANCWAIVDEDAAADDIVPVAPLLPWQP